MLIECLVLIMCSLNQTDQIVTTDDGKKVVLMTDGTWKYATKEDIATVNAGKRITLVDIVKNDSRFDFRNVRWGMNKIAVKSAENANLLSETPDKLEYEIEFMGYACKVRYTFIQGKLQQTDMLISQDHADPAKYYKDYEDLINYLVPIYGRPMSDIKDWKNDMYKSDRSRWGFAISIGFLTAKTVWNNKRSQVTLNISGGNHKIATNLEYVGIVME